MVAYVVLVGRANIEMTHYQLPLLAPACALAGAAVVALAGRLSRARHGPALRLGAAAVLVLGIAGATLVHAQRVVRNTLADARMQRDDGRAVARVTPPGSLIVVTTGYGGSRPPGTIDTPPEVFSHADRRGWFVGLHWLTPETVEARRAEGAVALAVPARGAAVLPRTGGRRAPGALPRAPDRDRRPRPRSRAPRRRIRRSSVDAARDGQHNAACRPPQRLRPASPPFRPTRASSSPSSSARRSATWRASPSGRSAISPSRRECGRRSRRSRGSSSATGSTRSSCPGRTSRSSSAEPSARASCATTSSTVRASEDEIFLARHLLDKQIVDINGVKVVRVNDLKLDIVSGDLVLTAADVGVTGLVRRVFGAGRHAPRRAPLGPRRSPRGSSRGTRCSPSTHSSTASRRRCPQERLQRLHPADIADILSQVSGTERTGIFRKLDVETAAETLHELEPEIQAEILEDLPEQRASEILEQMPADEAADVLGDLEGEHARDLVQLMEKEAADEVTGLLVHDENTAGGLMGTDFGTFPPDLIVKETLLRLRAASARAARSSTAARSRR